MNPILKMEDWQKEFVAMLEKATLEVEQFFGTVSEVVEEVTEEISRSVEAIALSVQATITSNIELYWQDLFEPIVEIYSDFEEYTAEDIVEEIDLLLTPKLEATREKYPACIGCRHYHGRIYGDNLLVCGMHPYGWEDENCPDWEKED